MVSPAKHKANEKYNSKTYEDVRLRLKIGEREKLKKAADQAGCSVNSLILLALNQYTGLDFSIPGADDHE